MNRLERTVTRFRKYPTWFLSWVIGRVVPLTGTAGLQYKKMTKQEVKEERKNYEGDPQVKARLRQRMREILQANMMRKVPEADVVVTNPTHFAVALEYQRASMDAPRVTAKGQDHLAQRIKAIAAENDVPVMENKPLARALYADVEVGDQIPVQHYQAVAEVLKLVYRMNNQKEAG